MAAPGTIPPLDDYQQFLVRRIADGVQRAVNNLAPARLACIALIITGVIGLKFLGK